MFGLCLYCLIAITLYYERDQRVKRPDTGRFILNTSLVKRTFYGGDLMRPNLLFPLVVVWESCVAAYVIIFYVGVCIKSVLYTYVSNVHKPTQ